MKNIVDVYDRWNLCWRMIQKEVSKGNMKKAIGLLTWARNLSKEMEVDYDEDSGIIGENPDEVVIDFDTNEVK